MKRVILVLGGGGMKGMAHVGAWRALQDAGVEVAEIVGTSIGALIAAMIGGGASYGRLIELALALDKKDIVGINRWALMLNGIRQLSVFRGEPFQEYIRTVLPVERFDAMRLPVGMNAVDLETGEQVWFGAGGRVDVPVAEAVYASAALPVFYPPAVIGGRHYVDGGVADTLPVTRAAERGADWIIEVDASSGAVKDAYDTVSKGMIAIHHRVYDVMAHARREAIRAAWSGPPLLRIRPRLEGYSTFDFTSTKYFLDEGYRATMDALGRPQQARPPVIASGD